MLWLACNKAGGEIHITKEEFTAMPRGALLEQKQTSVGVKVSAQNPWKLDVTDAPTEKELLKEFDRPDLDALDDATGSTQTTE